MSHPHPPPLWQIEMRVAEIASEQIGTPRHLIKSSSRLIEDLHVDSLELIELIIALEDEFAIELPDGLGKQLFVSQPVTIGVVAETVARQWGTGKPSRTGWFAPKAVRARAGMVPFTQYGGVLAVEEYSRGPLYEPIAATPRGAAQFRRATDGMRCVRVPAAEVEIGTDAGDASPDERPLHSVTLSEFLIDAEPVSVLAYARFLNSIGDVTQEVLEDWCVLAKTDRRRKHFQLEQSSGSWRPVTGTGHQPMVLVSWFGASAYALWANRLDWREYAAGTCAVLPTEAQWEYAAHGAVPQEIVQGHVALHRARETYDGLLPLAPVNAEMGMAPFDLHHMAGNVWQWCADWYSPEFFHSAKASGLNPRNDAPTGIKSERGGSWVSPAELARASYRRGRPPLARGRCLGFRCVGNGLTPEAS